MQFGFDPAPAAGLGQPFVEPVQGLVDPAFVFGDLVKPVDASDLALWARIEDSRKAADFEGYLRRFPRGCFAERARRLRDALATEGEIHYKIGSLLNAQM